MVALGISEFTFGFAFLHEQTIREWGGLKVAPILPSLYKEANLGWDAKLPTRGAEYYYQFKLSDYLYRSNASYIRDGIYSDAYYRIALHRTDANRQHRLLKALADRHPHTFYVAPEVRSSREFNEHFLNRDVVGASRLIPLKSCKQVLDDNQHYITFQNGDRKFTEHSEPIVREDSVFGRDISNLYEDSRPRYTNIDDEYFRQLFRNLNSSMSAAESDDRLRRYDPTVRPRHEDRLRSYDPTDRNRDEVVEQIDDLLQPSLVLRS